MPHTMIPKILCFATPEDAKRLTDSISVKHEMVIAPTGLLDPEFLGDRGPFQAVIIEADSTGVTIRQIRETIAKCRVEIPTLLHRRGKIVNHEALLTALRKFKINHAPQNDESQESSGNGQKAKLGKDRHTILAVDDDPITIKMVSRILKREGYNVVTAENGVVALDLIRRHGVSIVVSDKNMPEMDGIELCQAIRHDETLGVVYFVMITSQSEMDQLRAAFDAGADDFVPKPFEHDELVLRVRAGIRTVELERDLFRQKLEVQKCNAELAALNVKLEQLATTDELTGLLNRRQAMVKLAEFAELSSRYNIPLSCLVCDLDHFKRINDTHGHATGDQALKRSAEAIVDSIRNTDIATRVGGEEFLILCPNTDLEAARIIAERVRANVEKLTSAVEKPECFTTISVGVAQFEAADQSHDNVIKEADSALYAAKSAGRNCVCVASDVREVISA